MYLLLSIAGLLFLVAIFVVLGRRFHGGRGVVIQVTEAPKLDLVIGNAINTARALPGVDLVIVVCGPAVAALERHSPLARRIDEAGRHGIRILVCEDSMRGLQLGRRDMCPGMDYVAYALTEIVIRQFGGWTYVRA